MIIVTTTDEEQQKKKGRPQSEHYVKESEIRVELAMTNNKKLQVLQKISVEWDEKINRLSTEPERKAMGHEKEKVLAVADSKTYCTDKLVEIIVLTVDRIATLTMFRHYTYLDDMKAEAIYQSIRGITKFDLTKKNESGQHMSSFSYLSQIIHNAFKQILKKEKRNRDIKDQVIERMVDEQMAFETDFDSVRRKKEKMMMGIFNDDSSFSSSQNMI
jgi:hypothetical protein